jgi:hypothetical protein
LCITNLDSLALLCLLTTLIVCLTIGAVLC